jgi:alginate O-acetyltransferase complex protein AlgI
MVFSSSIFLFAFLPGLLLLYVICWKFSLKASNIILLLGSLFFILWGSGKDTLILITMILTNYTSGLLMTKGKNGVLLVKGEKRTAFQKTVLILTLIFSFSLLVYFKYASFLGSNASALLSIFGISWEVPLIIKNIILPLGISFYTFQALSYTLDVYFGNVESTKSLLNFSLYVSFFPQLIAGPIVRYSHIYKQINKRTITLNSVYEGMLRFMAGFTKKVLLANTVARAADGIFDLPSSELHTSLVWVGVIAYTLQIYLDFSAYSDMAIGLAKIFGFELKENFKLPYIAKSIQDFWRRWHISLSSWFRDYLYFPLGGNRKGRIRTYINLVIVFFICGLWHGAAWNFVIWGLWHGFFLVIERGFLSKILEKLPKAIRHIYTLLVVMIGWVLFRSETLTYAVDFLKTMFIPKSFSGQLFRVSREYLQNDVVIAFVFGIIASLGFMIWLKKKCDSTGSVQKNIFSVVVILLFLLSITSIYSGAYNPFIYFRF